LNQTVKSRSNRPSTTGGSRIGTDSLHQVVEVQHLTEHTYVLRLNRGTLTFKAGQCVNVGLPGTAVNREYSTYSGEDDPQLDFLIREVRGGVVSTVLKASRPGDEVLVQGPYGEFCLQEPLEGRSYLLIGTGTGIAPFHSFVRSHPALDYRILHGVRSAEETYDRQDYDSARYVSCLSQDSGGDFQGRVTDYLAQYPVKENTVCYLCGNRVMINDVYELLRSQGVSSDNLFTEVFF
jgi:ferredoxin/flavodoxin---NADP+ reductase